MRISLATRATLVCAAATLAFPLGLQPSFARMGGTGGASFARSGPGAGHFPHAAPRGFNRRFDFGRSGFDRFGDRPSGRFGFNRSGRFNRFGFNRFRGDQLLVGGWGWGGSGGFPAASAPSLAGAAAPVIINIDFDPAPGAGAAASAGACVIHALNYDSNGKYVGERQIPRC
jgi:hypothetical protein